MADCEECGLIECELDPEENEDDEVTCYSIRKEQRKWYKNHTNRMRG